MKVEKLLFLEGRRVFQWPHHCRIDSNSPLDPSIHLLGSISMHDLSRNCNTISDSQCIVNIHNPSAQTFCLSDNGASFKWCEGTVIPSLVR